MALGSSDEEDYVSIGTPVPEVNDDQQKKPTTIQDLTAKDKQGRRRFHGAFTGGFSAGFFNTVGTKEGFTPSTFVSSRKSKTEDGDSRTSRHSQPEDFMDDEDLEEHGIAPRKFATVGRFTSEERKRKQRNDSSQVASSSILNMGSLINDLVVPEQLTVGIKLLRKMGWKEGQGLGPRIEQKKKKKKKLQPKPGVKVYGCAPPPAEESDSSDEFVPEDISSVSFAPKDIAPISVVPKENVHGLGYRGLDPALALPSSHINLFSAPPVRSKGGRKGISGQAFGVGAFEDEDEDIYAVDSLSNYDITMQPDDERDSKFGWTAPRDHGKQTVPVNYLGKLLDGFCLSKTQLKPKKKFPAPTLPKGFKPHHWFRKQREMSHIPEHLRQGSENYSNPKLNAVDRGILLGETPVMNSVFDLVPNADRQRMDATKEAISMTKALTPLKDNRNTSLQKKEPPETTAQTTEHLPSTATPAASNFLSKFQPAASPNEDLQQKTSRQNTPLFQDGLTFQPFRKDPVKQSRYDKYLALLKQGVNDPHNAVASPNMTEWERARERDEFSKAAKMFRPMSAMMSSRFVSGTMIDDDMVETSIDPEKDKTDEVKAAEMKMFGKLTREECEWHPHQLLCKRFNVPNPFPGSDIVGIPGVKRDKYSVFNFLTVGDFQAGETQEPSSSSKEVAQPEELKSTARAKKATMASVFKVLDDPNFHRPQSNRENASQSKPTLEAVSQPGTIRTSVEDHQNDEEKENLDEEEQSADMDLFRAIFKNSDSEDSDKEEEIQENKDAELSSEDAPSSPDAPSEDTTETAKQELKEPTAIKTELSDEVEVIKDSFRPLFNRRKKPQEEQQAAALSQQEASSDVSCSTAGIQTVDKSLQWRSQSGAKSIFSVLEDVEKQDSLKSKETAAVFTQCSEDKEVNDDENEAEAYGPSLPPVAARLALPSEDKQASHDGGEGEGGFSSASAFGPNIKFPSASSLRTDLKEGGRLENTNSNSRSRKETKSSHKKEKRKNSKHKKHKKHKKTSKSRTKSRKSKYSSSGSEADTESDSGDSVSDSELLNRLREVSKSNKSLEKIKH
ncbi:G patch domain-containing protein 1 [Elysia marginata]|uniref:G patch domain-containing protein 1 n=1 Tax=Elysia marginata TaxID=1093978 RepID=A0AAV4EM48_9GAST|nr:G patch domain-containing protein 1 [Elysia marginata]